MMALTAGGTAAAVDAERCFRCTTKIRGERMEVAVAIGTDPATTFSARLCRRRRRLRSI
jgi:4-hydroxy-3-polyprenylbenzoate decarboxylase